MDTRRDGRLERGAQTRRATLGRAVQIASVEGLDGLTIGRLAAELELSKSGIFAHFGSKEELQLATIGHATEIFQSRVVEPAMQAPPGLPRLASLCEHWLESSRARMFPGGCFFAAVAAEFDARDGRVHDEVARGRRRWIRLFHQVLDEAVELAQVADGVDPQQLAFELDALVRAANNDAVLFGDEAAYERARTGIRARIALAERQPA